MHRNSCWIFGKKKTIAVFLFHLPRLKNMNSSCVEYFLFLMV